MTMAADLDARLDRGDDAIGGGDRGRGVVGDGGPVASQDTGADQDAGRQSERESQEQQHERGGTHVTTIAVATDSRSSAARSKAGSSGW